MGKIEINPSFLPIFRKFWMELTKLLLDNRLCVRIKAAEDGLTLDNLQTTKSLFVELFLLIRVAHRAVCGEVVTDTTVEERAVVVLGNLNGKIGVFSEKWWKTPHKFAIFWFSAKLSVFYQFIFSPYRLLSGVACKVSPRRFLELRRSFGFNPLKNQQTLKNQYFETFSTIIWRENTTKSNRNFEKSWKKLKKLWKITEKTSVVKFGVKCANTVQK